ncbi:MAG: hypothetical protein K8S94_04130 [Planctomycetia bacterium]|nr:hypothetical protein [Planctomycetia bacterium]
MPRPRRNPFYPLLGIVGVVFTVTSMSYCLSVLRGVRPETAAGSGSHPIEKLMDRHGTAILTGELALLAIATVGAIALDQSAGERSRTAQIRERVDERTADRPAADRGTGASPDDGHGAP